MPKPIILLVLLAFAVLWSALQPKLAEAQEPRASTAGNPLPLTSPSAMGYNQTAHAWSIIHERARIEAEGRLYRSEFNNMIGHLPARPNMNASYMSTGRPIYYIPARGQFVNAGQTRSWYW
jgi:hypothetical protein